MEPVTAGALVTGGANLLGSALGGFMGWKGADQTNKINQREAQKNRDFQERMSNTQWQRAVEDMRQAGINPALAYQQGPNSAPGGATAAPAVDKVGSALQASQMRKQLALLDAQVKSARAQARIDTEEANVQTRRPTLLLDPGDGKGPAVRRQPSYIGRMASLAENRARIEQDGMVLNNILTGVNTTRNRYLGDITKVGSDIAGTFGIFGPILAGLAAPGGVGISSARGLAASFRRMNAIRRARKAGS